MAHSYQVVRLEETVLVNFGLVGAFIQAAAGLAARLGPDGRIVQLTEIASTVVGVDQVTYSAGRVAGRRHPHAGHRARLLD